jgi:hypothetical protein
MPNPNLELLELAAERLRPLLSEIVFVGGCATGLLINDRSLPVVHISRSRGQGYATLQRLSKI